jgi:hypothetical protein
VYSLDRALHKSGPCDRVTIADRAVKAGENGSPLKRKPISGGGKGQRRGPTPLPHRCRSWRLSPLPALPSRRRYRGNRSPDSRSHLPGSSPKFPAVVEAEQVLGCRDADPAAHAVRLGSQWDSNLSHQNTLHENPHFWPQESDYADQIRRFLSTSSQEINHFCWPDPTSSHFASRVNRIKCFLLLHVTRNMKRLDKKRVRTLYR